MTISTEELARLLPLAARAMGICLHRRTHTESFEDGFSYDETVTCLDCGKTVTGATTWAPQDDSNQCAEMNAALMHTTCWYCDNTVQVSIQSLERTQHDGTTQGKVRAWREASVRAAARVGEQMEQEEVK